MSSTDSAALKLEIARLTGAINRAKAPPVQPARVYPGRNATYVNPNYKPPSRSAPPAPRPQPVRPAPGPSAQKRDVVIGGVEFESSGRSLVRKDLPKPPKPVSRGPPPPHVRNAAGHLVNPRRVYKPKTSGRRPGRNMTLNNKTRPAKKRKYVEKPCPRFTTTGSCSRGLTCAYQHDPDKIAICWPFLQGSCPHTADSCALSHDATPQRTPLCVHFANAGRCTRAGCPFPHVRVGAREGVCRDFAVLGFCEKGLECAQQHVRECPDFAEKGACTTKGCRLPHVIRANRNRKPAVTTSPTAVSAPSIVPASSSGLGSDSTTDTLQHPTAENAQLGDEFISLTFNESEGSDEEEESEEDDDEDSEASDADRDTQNE